MNSPFKKAATALIAAALLLGAGCSRDASKTTGQTVDDSAISAKVKAAFAKDPGVKAIEVKVDTYKGAVQLSGWVSTPEEKARAEGDGYKLPSFPAEVFGVTKDDDLAW